jgi:hypothetical protein
VTFAKWLDIVKEHKRETVKNGIIGARIKY